MWIRKVKDCDNVNFNKKIQKLKKKEKIEYGGCIRD